VSNKFGIIGYGYVGKATHLGLLHNQKCTVHDTIFNTSILDLKTVEHVFVCVPTNTDTDIDNIIHDLKFYKILTKMLKLSSEVPCHSELVKDSIASRTNYLYSGVSTRKILGH
jgi:hypothetical protein